MSEHHLRGSCRSGTGSAGPVNPCHTQQLRPVKTGTKIIPRTIEIPSTLGRDPGPKRILKSWKGRFAYAAAALGGEINSNRECFTKRVLPNYAMLFARLKKKKDPLGSQATRM